LRSSQQRRPDLTQEGVEFDLKLLSDEGRPAISTAVSEFDDRWSEVKIVPIRIAALGGHETRNVAAHEIKAQLAQRRVDALEQYHWSSYAFFAGTRIAPAWLCTESILAFFGPGSPCELQKAFRQQLREEAAVGRWETDWKAQVKYTVFLGSAEFVAQMRKLLRGDRDQQTGVRRGALEALTWTQIV
jgi:hypothetical protein